MRWIAIVLFGSWITACASPRALVASAPRADSHDDGAGDKARPKNQFLVHIGGRSLEDDFFYDPVDKPIALGFEYARDLVQGSNAGFGFEVGAFLAGDADDVAGNDVTSTFLEAGAGLRARIELGPVELYAGFGPNLVLAAIDIENGPNDEDGSGGFYGHGGVLFRIGTFSLGADVRKVSGTDVEFDGFVPTDADYSQVTLVFGWRR